MDEVVAVVSPTWILVAGTAGLFVVAFILGWVACAALGIRRRVTELESHAADALAVQRELRRVEARVDEHLDAEHCGPVAVRIPRPIRP